MSSLLKKVNKLIPVEKYEFKNNSIIVENKNEKYVVKYKKSDKDIVELNKYLKSRDFDNYAPLVKNDDNLDVYDYIDDVSTPLEQKAIDIANTLSLLHNKTTYFKEINKDTYKEIYEVINNNILYLQNYYEVLATDVEKNVFMSPSEYLFIKNLSIINNALRFAKDELDNWLEIVKEKTKQRVCVVHNNITLEHFLKNENNYLISWDKSTIDTPILDLIVFYKNEYNKIVFSDVLERYLSRYPLLDEEQKLFFIIISLPPKIEFTDNVFSDCKKITEDINYIYKSNELTGPYYSTDEIEEEQNFQ